METQFFNVPARDKRLGRNVKHDPRSIGYAFRSERNTVVQSVMHEPDCKVFDQGNVGSCTGNAALTIMSTRPMTPGLPNGIGQARRFVENDAVSLYSEATRVDGFQGDFPPNDTGSDGLSVAKVLRARGWISGYRHVLSGATGLALALQSAPVSVGINWYSSFFEPGRDGLIEISRTATITGGHQIALIGYDSQSDDFIFRQSWGPEWGDKGNGRMTGATLDRLMGEDGDATVFVPATEPAPEPIEDLALARLVGKLDPWFRRRLAVIGANEARNEIRAYLSKIGAM